MLRSASTSWALGILSSQPPPAAASMHIFPLDHFGKFSSWFSQCPGKPGERQTFAPVCRWLLPCDWWADCFGDCTDYAHQPLCITQNATHNWLFFFSAVEDSPLDSSVLGSLINRHLRNRREAFNMHQIPPLSRESHSVSKLCIPPCPHSLTTGEWSLGWERLGFKV